MVDCDVMGNDLTKGLANEGRPLIAAAYTDMTTNEQRMIALAALSDTDLSRAIAHDMLIIVPERYKAVLSRRKSNDA